MGLYSGGLIIGRIFASEILGAYFREGLFCFLFFCFFCFCFFFGGGGGGGLIIGILRYLFGRPGLLTGYPTDRFGGISA